MARSVEERSQYWFDPTASEAIARVDCRQTGNSARRFPDVYYASAEDLSSFRNTVFEPDAARLVTSKHIRRRSWQARQLEKALKVKV